MRRPRLPHRQVAIPPGTYTLEDYAWEVHAEATELAKASGCTFEEAAETCIKVSDALTEIR